jgi:cell division protein FtsB
MRLVTVVLISLLVLIQYPLWWGHGGWLRVRDLEHQLVAQEQKNEDLKQRNERLKGEVQDLEQGTDAVEERARYELGMIKDSEIFVQFVSPNQPLPTALSSVVMPASSTRGEMSAAPVRVVPDPPPRTLHDKKKAGKAGKGAKGAGTLSAANASHTVKK